MNNMQDQRKPNRLLEFVLICVGILITIMIVRNGCNKADTTRDQTNFINSLYDSIRRIRQHDSSEKASISILQSSSPSDFIKLKIKDAEIVSLQSLVEIYKEKLKAGSSVTTASTTTSFQHKGITVITVHDTVITKNNTFLYPEYTDTVNNQWISYRATMNKDSSYLDLKVINRYAVVLGYEKKKPFVDVVNYNPYSSTRILRSYQVIVPKQKMWGIGFSSGVCIGSGLKLQPYLGVGIQYNVIKF